MTDNRSRITRTELIESLRQVAAEWGADVSYRRFRELTGVPESQVRALFGTWRQLQDAADLGQQSRSCPAIDTEELWQAYHNLVEQLGRFPALGEIDRMTEFSGRTYTNRFGRQSQVQKRYRQWLTCQPAPEPDAPVTNMTCDETPAWNDPSPREVEAGRAIGRQTPHWMLQRWRQVRVTFAVASSDYRGHPLEEWDLLVVLDHDWLGCPIKVLPLQEVLPNRIDEHPVPDAPAEPTRSELFGY